MAARLDFPVASPRDFEALRERFAALPMQAKLMASREAGIDISSPGRQSFTLLVGEETAGRLYAGDVRLMPGFGAPPHHQPTEDELWYILEGRLDARIGERRLAIGAGAFAYIPKNTTHAFRNNGTEPARMVTWNSPAGHERAFEEMKAMAARGITAFPDLRDMFRQHGVWMHADDNQSAENDRLAGGKVVPGRHEAPDVSWEGVDARLLLSGPQSRGDFDVFDLRLAPGAGLPAHAHGETDKCVYVVSGEAELAVGGERRRVVRGAFAFVPRGTPMELAQRGSEAAHVLLWCTPGRPDERRLLRAPDCLLAG